MCCALPLATPLEDVLRWDECPDSADVRVIQAGADQGGLRIVVAAGIPACSGHRSLRGGLVGMAGQVLVFIQAGAAVQQRRCLQRANGVGPAQIDVARFAVTSLSMRAPAARCIDPGRKRCADSGQLLADPLHLLRCESPHRLRPDIADHRVREYEHTGRFVIRQLEHGDGNCSDSRKR